MQKIIFSLLFICIYNISQAQKMNDYSTEWKEIDSLNQKGLPESALLKLKFITTDSKNNQNYPQYIKALLQQFNLKSNFQEDDYVALINELRTETDISKAPYKPILQSILGEIYTSYYQSRAYGHNARSTVSDFDISKPDSWSNDDFYRICTHLYDESIATNTSNLPASYLDPISVSIMTKDAIGDTKVRPTVYDVLVFRVLNFYENQSFGLNEPVYKFLITDDAALGSTEQFLNWKISTQDSSSKLYKALLVYQKIIKYNQSNNKNAVLVDAELSRLQFVYNNCQIDIKDSLYEKALKGIIALSTEEKLTIKAYVRWISIYQNKLNGDKVNDDDVKKFVGICNEANKKLGDKNSIFKNILLEAKYPTLSFQLESENVSNKPILMHLNYKNVKDVQFNIYTISPENISSNYLNQNSIYNSIANLKPIQTWNQSLSKTDEFKTINTEVLSPIIPSGYYIITASINPKSYPKEMEFNDNLNTDLKDKNWIIISHSSFQSTNIATITRNNGKGSTEIYVLDRTSGKPLSGVKAEFYEQVYNPNTYTYSNILSKTMKSDKNGIIIPNLTMNKSFQVIYSLKKEVYYSNEWLSNYNVQENNWSNTNTHLFLDRAIYRPGQTIYFKGLLIESSNQALPKIVSKKQVEITFLDVNYQVISKQTFSSNDYGSFNGSFMAPTKGLLGQMYIQSSLNGGTPVRVEEYKRPKYKVEFKPISDAFKLGQLVNVSGQAKAFAGNNIDNAKVSYTIKRTHSFPYFNYWSKGYFPYPSGGEMIIKNDETITDENGNFTITFNAIADRSIDKKWNPNFNFLVEATITDQNGEVQSTNITIAAGYKSLVISTDLGEMIDKGQKKEFKLSTKNLNNIDVNTACKVQIMQLESPNQYFDTRFWVEPEITEIEKTLFKKYFPNFSYKNEDVTTNWKKLKSIYDQTITSNKDGNLTISNLNTLTVGSYYIEATTRDTFGDLIEYKYFFSISDKKNGKIPVSKPYFTYADKESYEPKTKATINFIHNMGDVFAFTEILKKNNSKVLGWKNISKNVVQNIDIEESDRGNTAYQITMLKNNRLHQINQPIVVPWSNKDLNIEYVSFRDKLEPGQPESWTIKVSGKNKDKIAAEVVAGMYDASLDQFAANNWLLSLYDVNYLNSGFRFNNNLNFGYFMLAPQLNTAFYDFEYRILDIPIQFQRYYRGGAPMNDMVLKASSTSAPSPVSPRSKGRAEKEEKSGAYRAADAVANETAQVANAEGNKTELPKSELVQPLKIRKNLEETTFFYPILMTDSSGNIIIKFTAKEALTQWKVMLLAHTKDLKIGLSTKTVTTSKILMVFPNAPRFVRQGDKLFLPSKISNTSDKSLGCKVTLELLDAVSLQPLNYIKSNPTQNITIDKGKSENVSWELNIPQDVTNPITYRVIATSESYSDGEENVLPILPNKMLVTESLPLPIRSKQEKSFTLQNLKNNNSTTLSNHSYTLEFTSNPVWYAVQSLPYLMEYPYECTEQIMSRLYANTLASFIANKNPKIKAVFDRWKNTNALQSNLQKNQELKNVLLEETPWVLQALNEEQQKKNIALLFDLNKMSNEYDIAVGKLAERQLSNGGFPWFPGDRDNAYITQCITEMIGHLIKLKVINSDAKINEIGVKAVSYNDLQLINYYDEIDKLVKAGKTKWEDNHMTSYAIHNLYTRSFFTVSKSEKYAKVYNYFAGQADQFWTSQGLYEQGMISLILNRNNKKTTAQNVLKSVKERAIKNPELGYYWNYNWGYNWNALPIETHSLMIEAFEEINNDAATIDELKVWLIKNKQTNSWKTTKATSAAIYALLLSGTDWVMEDNNVQISIGNKEVDTKKIEKEPGTGYFKINYPKNEITKDKADIKLKNDGKTIAWGAVYWQYFENLDKITTFKETPLKIEKQLYKQVKNDKGTSLIKIDNKTTINIGDKIIIRMILAVDRPMEFVHIKDMRAAGFEPTNVLSQYKYQDGLGYYESTKDASTNYFISYLPRGRFVLEYPVNAQQKGTFSNGITQGQCMYAPEFSSHSEGVSVEIK